MKKSVRKSGDTCLADASPAPGPRHASWRRLAGLGLILGVTVLAGFPAFYRVFTWFAWYDDEGSLMITLKPFLAGHVLYDEVFSQYGPAYYLYKWLLHTLTNAPVTHNAERWHTWLAWLVSTLLCAGYVWRATGSAALGLLTQLAAFYHLSALANEPAHPQELVALLLVAVLCVSWGRGAASLAALGCLAALAMLTKINVGIFLVASLGLTVVQSSGGGRLRRAAALAGSVVVLILPVTVMRAHLGDPAMRNYCAVVTLALLAILIVGSSAAPRAQVARRGGLFFAGGLGVTLALVVGFVVARGTTLRGLLDALILRNLEFPTFFHNAPTLPNGALVWAVAAVVIALAYRATRGRTGSAGASPARRCDSPWLHGVITVFKAAFVIMVAYGEYGIYVEGLRGLLGRSLETYAWLLSMAGPGLWLVLIPSDGHAARDESSFPRQVLAVVGGVQLLQGYPVAGSQLAFATLALVPAAGWCLGDVVRYLARGWPARWNRRWVASGAAACVLVLAATGHEQMRRHCQGFYAGLEGLPFAGAERVHAEPGQVELYRWLVANLRANCDTFISLPGMNSIYFWAGLEPPSALNNGAWFLLFTARQQQDIVAALAQHPRAGAIVHPDLASWWLRGQTLAEPPLVKYIRTEFETVARDGNVEFRLRREREPASEHLVTGDALHQ